MHNSQLKDFLHHLTLTHAIKFTEQISEHQRHYILDLFSLEADDAMIQEMSTAFDRPLINDMVRFILKPEGENIGKLQRNLSDHLWHSIKDEIQDLIYMENYRKQWSNFKSENDEHLYFDNKERTADIKN
jgi:hypothetical protein